MSSSFRFELNRAGVRELLRSGEMQNVLREAAQGVQNKASGMTGLEYSAEVKVGKNRAVATVACDSAHAYYENLKNNTLVKALGGG